MISKARICPHCGNDQWYVTAHVTQDWIVDSMGNFQECIDDCVEVVHAPDEDDVWVCTKCGKEYPNE